jgi:uncharacterized protein YcaQ
MFLPNAQARRLFLHRHALAEPPTGPASGPALAALVDRLGFVQVDSINTVERAHHMILWSRRQSYKPADLHRLIEQDRTLWEHWTHDAAILPTALHGHWHHRFASDAIRLRTHWANWFRPGYEALLEQTLRRIEAEGPLTTADVGAGEARGSGGWWDWHPSKTALEWLWRTGQLAITRREGFRKVYDLTERVIPESQRAPKGDRAHMIHWACFAALDRLGFADAGELRAFWHLITPQEAKHWAQAALKWGEIALVEIEGADGRRKQSLARPDVVQAAAEAPEPPPRRIRILSPFDPALRDRARAEFLFGFRYRIEVFVPEAKRQYGYYVFPVLEGSHLIGRVDVKAFRDQSTLRLRAFWPEKGVALTAARLQQLDAELNRLATFAGCDRVERADDWQRATLA